MGQSEFSFRDNGLFQREDWLLTYDSERRLGNIRHGKHLKIVIQYWNSDMRRWGMDGKV